MTFELAIAQTSIAGPYYYMIDGAKPVSVNISVCNKAGCYNKVNTNFHTNYNGISMYLPELDGTIVSGGMTDLTVAPTKAMVAGSVIDSPGNAKHLYSSWNYGLVGGRYDGVAYAQVDGSTGRTDSGIRIPGNYGLPARMHLTLSGGSGDFPLDLATDRGDTPSFELEYQPRAQFANGDFNLWTIRLTGFMKRVVARTELRLLPNSLSCTGESSCTVENKIQAIYSGYPTPRTGRLTITKPENVTVTSDDLTPVTDSPHQVEYVYPTGSDQRRLRYTVQRKGNTYAEQINLQFTYTPD